MEPAPAKTERPLADHIDNPDVRDLFVRLLDGVGGLHRDVAVVASGVDVRMEVRGRTVCRLVPYRELIHVQVEGATSWESRIRDETGYLEVLDRLLTAFLRAFGTCS
jgi:hypothetical protein